MRPMSSGSSQTPSLPSAPETMIEMHNVVKTFKNAAGEFTVLKGINLQIARGEFVAVIGKSGSGKSTLLNMLTGIDHPTSGKVIIGGADLYAMTESQRSLWRGKNLGIVFQFFQLLPMLSLLENVMLPMDYTNTYEVEERPKRAMELLALVGVEKLAHKLPLAVSTGQQQQVAIARALATNPSLIAADEPTGNLDSRSAEAIINLFEQLTNQGKTIVMVTHDPSITERMSRTIILSDGEIIDETVAHCLPLLGHRQMLDVTKASTRQVFSAGQTILETNQQVDTFFMIARGQVEIVLRHGRVAARLGAGEFFGEIELIKDMKSLACVRAAANSDVELVTIPRAEFIRLLEQSPLTEEAIGRIVQARLQEHRISERRRRKP